MSLTDDRFDLVHEPWIRVIGRDCQTEEVSLLGAFERAHEYRDLSGELPTQDIAVLRLMLAILHAVFARVDAAGRDAPMENTDDAIDRWRELWALGRFPAEVIAAYLARWQSRFYLFDEERPFYQTPAAGAAVSGSYSASKLNGEISEGAHKPRFFLLRSGEAKDKLTYSEAARWLVHINAVDDCAVKKSDAYKKTQKNDSDADDKGPGVGWVGKLGIICSIGNNLFETLMQNMVMYDVRNDKVWGDEKPAWEREKVKLNERVQIPCPDNQSELLTLLSRMLMLQRKNGYVTGYAVLSGEFFQEANAFNEQMTLWRETKPSKARPIPVYLPMKHDMSRFMWQEFAPIFVRDDQDTRPGIVQWLTTLVDHEILPKKQILRFNTTGVQYCVSQSARIDDVFSDSLSLHADLLSDIGGRFVKRVEDEIACCDQIAAYVGYLAASLARASGASQKEYIQARAAEAREQYYFRLDMPFRQWLYGISPDKEDEIDAICDQWRETALGVARTLGKEMIDQIGLKAFTGREQKEKDSDKEKRLYTAPQAYNQFLYNLAKIK